MTTIHANTAIRGSTVCLRSTTFSQRAEVERRRGRTSSRHARDVIIARTTALRRKRGCNSCGSLASRSISPGSASSGIRYRTNGTNSCSTTSALKSESSNRFALFCACMSRDGFSPGPIVRLSKPCERHRPSPYAIRDSTVRYNNRGDRIMRL